MKQTIHSRDRDVCKVFHNFLIVETEKPKKIVNVEKHIYVSSIINEIIGKYIHVTSYKLLTGFVDQESRNSRLANGLPGP